MYRIIYIQLLTFFLFITVAPAQNQAKETGDLSLKTIPVSKPGSYGIPGAVYRLEKDISSSRSAIFLGKDVTLDLNGHTITFADTTYQQMPNFSFEDGLAQWDVSKAPGAKTEDTKVHVFVGENILRLAKGEEIVSPYIYLPVADRSYMAMCGVTRPNMKVSVFVEDEAGEQIVCNTAYRGKTLQSCPVESRSPRLGGGFILAHVNGLKAGKYRIRVRAETDCLIDYVDLRPAFDVGIGIVDKTIPMGHNDHFYEGFRSAFFDYTGDVQSSLPLNNIPRAEGRGTVTIKNGVIKNGTPGVLSWGIQSTADGVTVILENVRIINSGINAIAVEAPQAVITYCTFDVQNPFIINRHGASFYAVDLYGKASSEVSFSEFFGGQGCLSFKGDYSKIHNNFFANRQTVTNHYSIMAMGDSSLIFNNRIKPEVGSGIEVYVHRGMEIYNNEFHIEAAPPTCEYGHEDYSVAAIRIADYNAKPGSPRGTFGNRVYKNKIFVTGKDYPEYTDYIPMAWAVFYSSSAGENYFFANEIWVNDKTPGLKNETSAFYIGGGTIGGQFYDNTITTNVPAAWVASRYGGASNTHLYRNQIIKAEGTADDVKPFRVGWSRSVATDIEFRSNELKGFSPGMDVTQQTHSFSVWWTLKVTVKDKKGNAVKNTEVTVTDANGTVVSALQTGDLGTAETELMEYLVKEGQTSILSPYTITAGKKKEQIQLNKDLEITINW